jgi:hypothetical protein
MIMMISALTDDDANPVARWAEKVAPWLEKQTGGSPLGKEKK